MSDLANAAPSTDDPNADQVKFWNGEGGRQWAINQENMDTNLKPFADAALALASARSGEQVLDIGCGCGDTTLTLSASVGLDGHAVGLDISGPMIDRAKERAAAVETMGLPCPRFVLGDASSYAFKPERFDLLFSRFGVMFFADPAAAFANMRGALRQGGRTAFICWQPMVLNDFFMVPTAAALTILPAPDAPAPNAPGPFAFGDKDRLNGILKDAGFSQISIESLELDMEVGGGKGIEAAGRELTRTGPLARLVVDLTEDVREKVTDAVIKALEAHSSGGRVSLGSRTWLVSAKNN